MPVFTLIALADNVAQQANELGSRQEATQQALPVMQHNAAHNMRGHAPEFVNKTVQHRKVLNEVPHAGHPRGHFAGPSTASNYAYSAQPGRPRGHTKGHFPTLDS